MPSLTRQEKRSATPIKPATPRHPATRTAPTVRLHAFDSHRPLAIQPLRIPLVALLLAVLETLALVVFEQPMLSAEVAGAEAAVADDALCCVAALLETAPYLLGRHSAAQRQRHVQRCVGRDGVGCERRRGRGQVLTGVHEAQRGRQVCAESEEGAQGGDGGCWGEGEGDCCVVVLATWFRLTCDATR
jgi:hypothetical protein